MKYLLDTNILVRLSNAQDGDHEVATDAIQLLRRRGHLISITPQNLVEFRNAATRPLVANGLGLSTTEADRVAAEFEATFELLEDVPAVFPAWKALVSTIGIIGKQVHDARLVAVCHVHDVTHLLTFNGAHFARMAKAGPGLTVVAPALV